MSRRPAAARTNIEMPVVFIARAHFTRSGTMFWWHRPPACCFRRRAGNRLRRRLFFQRPPTRRPRLPAKFGGTPNLTGATPVPPQNTPAAVASRHKRSAAVSRRPVAARTNIEMLVVFIARANFTRNGTLFLVAQASGLLFPASRRKPFATTIIFPTTVNPQATSLHEIWRDAKFNRRDACSPQNHAGCCCVRQCSEPEPSTRSTA